MAGHGLSLRGDIPAADLRRLARREPGRAATARMIAIAGALEGFSRAEAARLAGMERRGRGIPFIAPGTPATRRSRAPARR